MTERELLDHSLVELEVQVKKYRQVLESVIERRPLTTSCIWSDCHHQQILLSSLAEAVQVLDETRKSFKSRQLEQLRKTLLHVLADETRCDQTHQNLLQLDSQQI